MNLKFVCGPLSGNGGTETVLVKVLNHLCINNQIDLYLTTIPSNKRWLEKLDKEINIHEVTSSNKLAKLEYLFRIFTSAQQDDCFVILGANIIKFAARIRKIFHKRWKIVSWIHYSLINQDMFDPHNIIYADRHWAISTPIKDQLIGLGIDERKISLLFNPIERFTGTLNDSTSNSQLRLLYVGKIMLDDQKNLRELFNGIKKYPSNNIYLDLFGADFSDGKVKEYVKKLGISQQCLFHEWTPNPWQVALDDIHPKALVLTSKYEGLPMVMLEGMARGIPSLVADFSGYEDIVNNQNGLVYKSGNINDLVNKMQELNGKIFDSRMVAKSIDKFYDYKYFERLDKALESL